MLAHEGAYATFFEELKKPSVGLCKVITLQNSESPATYIRMTDHDRDLVIGGETYVTANAFTPSAVRSRVDASVDNLAVEGVTNATITEDDLIRGVLDDWKFEFGVACWTNTAAGILPLKRGFLGEITARGVEFEAEFRSLSEYMQRAQGRAYLKECDAHFGDTRCGLDLVALGFVHSATVTTLGVSDRVFEVSEVQADGYFQYGICEFTSGNNTGVQVEIISHASDYVTLLALPPFPVAVSDTISLTRGCDRTAETCKTTFSNLARFRGFNGTSAAEGAGIWMPSDEDRAQTPDAK